MPKHKPMPWFPFYAERWLEGATREELEHDERAIFADFLCMASRTGGYVAANVDDGIPYPIPRLAEKLKAKGELIERTIRKCMETGKLKQLKSGILQIIKWKDYQLSARWIRELRAELKAEVEAEVEAEPIPRGYPEDTQRIGKDKKEDKKIPVGEDKSSNPYHSRFMGAWVLGSERYWGRKASKGLRGKAGAQFKRLFYPEFDSFARENPDRTCELIERVWAFDENQTTLERKCCKEGRTVGALTYLTRSVLQKERASESLEQDKKRTEERSKAEKRKLDEEAAATKREEDRLQEQREADPVAWAKCVLAGQNLTERALQGVLNSKFTLDFQREAAKILLEEQTKQPTSKEA